MHKVKSVKHTGSVSFGHFFWTDCHTQQQQQRENISGKEMDVQWRQNLDYTQHFRRIADATGVNETCINIYYKCYTETGIGGRQMRDIKCRTQSADIHHDGDNFCMNECCPSHKITIAGHF